MRFFLSVALTQFCLAQNPKDASALIQAVADTANSAKTWRIEGTIDDSRYTQAASFSLFMRAPAEFRFQQKGGGTPAVIVCDTDNAWTYSPPLNRYRTQPVSSSTGCGFIVDDWKSLPSTLKSPTVAGRRTIEIGGRRTNCELIRGETDPKPPLSGVVKRDLCIDRSTDLVVWEKEEFSDSSRTYAFTRIDRDIDMAPDIFVLKLPPGAEPTTYDLPIPERLGSLSMGRDPSISTPRPVKRPAPVYDEAFERSGTIILYVIIDTNGVPAEVDFYKHLSPGLDAAAVEAVRRWRFAPAMKNNQPVAVAQLIQLKFKRN